MWSLPSTRGSAASYYPETNVLVPLDSVTEMTNTPTSKGVLVRFNQRTTNRVVELPGERESFLTILPPPRSLATLVPSRVPSMKHRDLSPGARRHERYSTNQPARTWRLIASQPAEDGSTH